MIFKVNKDGTMVAFHSDWRPRELALESYLLPREGSDEPILAPSVFGEPLLRIRNQARTRANRRADILALDRAGSGVVVELKRDGGLLGVETQALQYLADFSAFRGRDFIKRFSGGSDSLEDEVRGFLGDDVRLEDINRRSRVILIARGFDPSIFSIGEWLSNSGAAFRCIEYTPFAVGGEQFLSFSVVFDRSSGPLYPLIFQSRAREPGHFWHNIGKADQNWWAFLKREGQISASFDNQAGDEGERVLKSYIAGDVVIAYAKGYGAIGWGVIERPKSYQLIEADRPHDLLGGEHLHRLGIAWKATAARLDEGVRPDALRNDFGIYPPRRTSVGVNRDKAKRLIGALNQRFSVTT